MNIGGKDNTAFLVPFLGALIPGIVPATTVKDYIVAILAALLAGFGGNTAKALNDRRSPK